MLVDLDFTAPRDSSDTRTGGAVGPGDLFGGDDPSKNVCYALEGVERL